MDNEVMEIISREIKLKKNAALAIVTKAEGSSPGKEGFMLGVLEDGSTVGTLGGGAVEFNAINKAKECMEEGKNGTFTFNLSPNGNLGMVCGGTTEIYIKTFKAPEKMLIVGGGHIALELYKLCEFLQFKSIIFEDRAEFGNNERFPNSEIILGDYKENLCRYPIDEHCYIIIVTRGHKCDEESIGSVINSNAAYIGMVGSVNKTKKIMNNLLNNGISKESISRVYAPIGLDLGGDTVSEIAISIMSEIMLVKNKGSLSHSKERLL